MRERSNKSDSKNSLPLIEKAKGKFSATDPSVAEIAYSLIFEHSHYYNT